MALPGERVVLTGIGALTPLGAGAGALWESVVAGRSGIRSVEGFDASRFPSRMAGEVRGFDPRAWLTAKTVHRTGRAAQMALAAAAMALEDAGWARLPGGVRETAVVLGSGYGSMPSVEEAYRVYFTEGWEKNPFLAVPLCMPNAAGSMIALQHGFRGPSYTLSAACASGSAAIAEAARLVRSGAVRRALTGGVDATVIPGVFSIWCRLGVMSTRNDDPEGACAPFSADRDGLVLGEGACVLALERLDDAERRGARVYAELAGAGSTCDGENVTAPRVEGEVEALRAALADAGLRPEEIGYVNAHGTGTALNDRVETQALHEAFGAGARALAVSSTKSMIGHTMGASGAIECAVTALALREQVLPPTRNLRIPDPACDLDYVPGRARAARVDAALSSSFAFGGSSVVLALRRYQG